MAVLVEVVAAVGEQLARLPSWAAGQAADWRDRVQQRQQLGDVVAVSPGQGDRERDAVGVDDQVVLGPGVAKVGRPRPDMIPPLASAEHVDGGHFARMGFPDLAGLGAVLKASGRYATPTTNRTNAATMTPRATREYQPDQHHRDDGQHVLHIPLLV
jgi:hypothetical protein